MWAPSRWWRSETWRSPSSSQIHQNYIYLWNNSYTTPTERWQKTSDFPKSKNYPRTWVGQKKKQRQKNRDKTCTSGRELGRRKGFHTLGSPFIGADRGWQGGSFGATEESAATEVRRAKWRDSHTEARSRAALTSLSRPVCSPARAGGVWELRLGLRSSDPRERTGVGCVNTAWRGLVFVSIQPVYVFWLEHLIHYT